ncbi:MAG: hypothetical protein ACOYBE_05460 [Blautia sp.]|jgi:hypothetical protein
MEQIETVGYLDYLIVFESCRSPLGDYYFQNRGGTIRALGIRDQEGVGRGVLLYERMASQTEILYLSVRDKREGVGTALLTYLVKQEKEKGQTLLFRIQESGKYSDILKKMAGKQGFSVRDTVELFRSKKEDYPRWQTYMKRHGERILKLLDTQGFEAVSFLEIPSDVQEEIRNLKHMDFTGELDPVGVMDGRKGHFCKEISYISMKDGHPAAYCLVCRPDPLHYVFEIISAAAKYQDTGVIFQPFAMAVNKVGEYPYRQVGFAVYQTNKKAIALTGRMMSHLISTRELQYNYIYERIAGGLNNDD